MATFIKALRDCTGLHGETLKDFKKQYEELSEADKFDLYQYMVDANVDVEPPRLTRTPV